MAIVPMVPRRFAVPSAALNQFADGVPAVNLHYLHGLIDHLENFDGYLAD